MVSRPKRASSAGEKRRGGVRGGPGRTGGPPATLPRQHEADAAAPQPARRGARAAAAAGAALTARRSSGRPERGGRGVGERQRLPAARGHEEGRARTGRACHEVPTAAGAGRHHGRLAPREPAQRLREELREPAAAGPPARLLFPPLPLLQRGAAGGLAPRRGTPLARRPGRLCPGRAAGRGARAPGGRGGRAAGAAERLLAQPQPALQHRLCLLLPHLLLEARAAGPGPRRRGLLVAAGAARLLLPGRLGGVARVVVAARGAGGGGRPPVPGAGLRGAADARPPRPPAPRRPGAALRRPDVVGVVLRPRGAAARAQASAVVPGRGRGMPAGPGPGPLLPRPGSLSTAALGGRRGRESAGDQTPEEVELRVAGRKRRRLLWQWQDVQETVVALHFPGTGRDVGRAGAAGRGSAAGEARWLWVESRGQKPLTPVRGPWGSRIGGFLSGRGADQPALGLDFRRWRGSFPDRGDCLELS